MSREVFEKSPAYLRMQAKRDLTETLWAGTPAMRDAARAGKWMWASEGEGKLVKVGTEKTTASGTSGASGHGMVTRYELRVRESVLEPIWRAGVERAAAMPFRRPWQPTGWSDLILGVERDGALVRRGFVHNADGTGRTAAQMLHFGFELGQAHGMDLILVDLPGESVPAERRRPYWSGVRASDLIDTVVSTDYDGMPRLEVARIIRRRANRSDEFAWQPSGEPEEIVKVYYAGELDAAPGTEYAKVRCEIYDSQGEFVEQLVVEPPAGEMREIPLVPIYGGRTGPYEADPPYYDQAEMQASLWRKASRYDWKLRHIASTVLSQTGVDYSTEDPKGGAGVDEDAIVWVADAAGKNEFIETTGAAVSALLEDLDRQKAAIRQGTAQASIGETTVDRTAFEIGVGLIEANTRLEADTIFLEASATRLLEFTSVLWGIDPSGGRVTISHDYGLPRAGVEKMAELYKDGKITAAGFLPVAREAGWFPDNWSVDEELARLTGTQGAYTDADLEARIREIVSRYFST